MYEESTNNNVPVDVGIQISSSEHKGADQRLLELKLENLQHLSINPPKNTRLDNYSSFTDLAVAGPCISKWTVSEPHISNLPHLKCNRWASHWQPNCMWVSLNSTLSLFLEHSLAFWVLQVTVHLWYHWLHLLRWWSHMKQPPSQHAFLFRINFIIPGCRKTAFSGVPMVKTSILTVRKSPGYRPKHPCSEGMFGTGTTCTNTYRQECIRTGG